MRTFLLLMTVFAICIIALGEQVSGDVEWVSGTETSAGPLFTITITALHDTVVVGSPVAIKIVTKNTSDRDITFWAQAADDPAGFSYKADVIDENGNHPPETKLRRSLRYNEENSPNIGRGTVISGNGVTVSLKPGDTQSFVSDLGRLYDFNSPGSYTIQVSRTAEESSTSIKSNAISVLVTAGTPNGSTLRPTEAPFSLKIKTSASTSKVGAPIEFEVVTTNISGGNILLWADKASQEQAGSAYQVDVYDPTGNTPPQTEFGRTVNNRRDIPRDSNRQMPAIGSGDELFLRPKESWTDTIVANKLYDLGPGEYNIDVRRFDPATKSMVKSNTIKVFVTP